LASITSVISFFILLLATYSYAAPVEHEYGTSTAEYEFTSGKTTIEQGHKNKTRPISDDEFTSVQNIHQQRSVEDTSSEEATKQHVTYPSSTVEDSSFSPSTETNPKRSIEDSSSAEKNEKRGVDDSSSAEKDEKRSIEDSSFVSPTDVNEKRSVEDSSSAEKKEKRGVEDSSSAEKKEKQGVEDSSSAEKNEKRSVDDSSSAEKSEKRSIEDFLLSTMESSTEFDRRAIRPVESEEEVKTSTSVSSENEVDTTTNVEPLSSSINSFGKITGLLRDNKTEEQSSTNEYETTDRPDEEFTTQSNIKTQKLTKTVAIIPGRITGTKIYAKEPTVIQSDNEKQSNQGQKKDIVRPIRT